MNIFDDIVITKIGDTLTIPHVKGKSNKMTNRFSYGLSFCRSGRIVYTKDGTKTVSDKTNAVILPQGASYTLRCEETGVFLLVNFRVLLPFTEDFISVPLENPDIYMKEFEELQKSSISGNSAKTFAIMYGLFHRLKNEGKSSDFLSPVIRYMEEHFCQEGLSNEVLASRLHLSEVYFRKLFKEHFGVTPHSYLIALRIEKAKQLLSHQEFTVTRIAEECGFSGVYHFCKVFKEHVGATPTDYRKSLEKLKI